MARSSNLIGRSLVGQQGWWLELRPPWYGSPAIGLLLIALSAINCSSWRAEIGPPRAVLPAEDRRATVRVTLADGASTVLEQAHTAADTLYGLGATARRVSSSALDWQRSSAPVRETAIPLDSVRTVETLRYNGAQTGLLAGGIIVGLVALAIAAFAGTTWDFQ